MTGVTFTYGLIGDPETLDPHFASSSAAIHLLRNSYNGLVTTDLDSNGDPVIVGDLATEWDYDPSSFTYTFTLRDDIYFHSQNLFDAYAAAYSVNRMTAGPLGSRFNSISSVTTPDSFTLVIDLSVDDPSFLADLAHPMAVMVDPAVINSTSGITGSTDAGTGPFEMTSFVQGDGAEFGVYSGYHRLGDLNGEENDVIQTVAAMNVRFLSSVNVAEAELAVGTVQYVANMPAGRAATLVATQSSPPLATVSNAPIGMTYLAVNYLPGQIIDNSAVLADSALRKGIIAAIDRQTLADTLGLAPLRGALPESHAMFGGQNIINYNASDPGALLEASGWEYDPQTQARVKNGVTLPTFTLAYDAGNQLHADTASAIASALAAVNVDVLAVAVSPELFNSPSDRPHADFYLLSRYGLDINTAEDWLYPTFFTGGSENIGGYSNLDVDDALEAAINEVDLQLKEGYFQDAEAALNDDAAFIPLFADAVVGVWNNEPGDATDTVMQAQTFINPAVGQPKPHPKQTAVQLVMANAEVEQLSHYNNVNSGSTDGNRLQLVADEPQYYNYVIALDGAGERTTVTDKDVTWTFATKPVAPAPAAPPPAGTSLSLVSIETGGNQGGGIIYKVKIVLAPPAPPATPGGPAGPAATPGDYILTITPKKGAKIPVVIHLKI